MKTPQDKSDAIAQELRRLIILTEDSNKKLTFILRQIQKIKKHTEHIRKNLSIMNESLRSAISSSNDIIKILKK